MVRGAGDVANQIGSSGEGSEPRDKHGQHFDCEGCQRRSGEAEKRASCRRMQLFPGLASLTCQIQLEASFCGPKCGRNPFQQLEGFLFFFTACTNGVSSTR